MAKKDKTEPIPPRCINCKYNLGEDEQFHYMWHCSFLSICCAFGLTYCKAEKLGKGKFEEK